MGAGLTAKVQIHSELENKELSKLGNIKLSLGIIGVKGMLNIEVF